jgi:hypothetical protein
VNKEFYFLDERERKKVIEEFKRILQEEESIIFAYLLTSEEN